MKVCHLTSVHHRNDTRIFYKELPALVEAGFQVSVVVADGKGDKQQLGYQVFDIGFPRNRLSRIFKSAKKVLKKALELKSDIYHLHDPELLFIGKRLKKLGKTVIYDAHEDVPRQILSKYWINIYVRKMISSLAEVVENMICRKLNLIITATPFIRERFLKINPNVIDINNFPILDPNFEISEWESRKQEICYIGSITEVRGILELVKAMSNVNDITLNLAGVFSHDEFRQKVTNSAGWENVKEYGFVDRKAAQDIMNKSIAGMVTLHPIINYIDSLPVKMFEYMGAGIPVIASDFPLWKEIVEKNNCGICVDPFDPDQITEAINFIQQNPEKAKQMGIKGLQMVKEKYNWETEKKKLISAYNQLTIVKSSI
jgi:glycosyltransferase involved in cell wall biosynthesis